MKKFYTSYDKMNCNETKNTDTSKVENAAVGEVSSDAVVSVDTEKGNNQVSIETEPAVFMPEKKKVVVILSYFFTIFLPYIFIYFIIRYFATV